MNLNWINYLTLTALVILYPITSCVGLYFLKVSEGWRTTMFISGLVLYALGAAQWILILRRMPLSMAFPIAAGALMIGTVLTGKILLKEMVTLKHTVGIVFIFLGITLIATSR